MFSITVGYSRIPKLRDLYQPAVRAMEARMQSHVRPQVEADVTDLLAPYPGPAAYPFQFATIKSQRFYFANFQAPYVRTQSLQAAWFVQIASQSNAGPLAILGAFFRQQPVAGQILIVIGNSDEAARYVYPPRQVPGHAHTGWNLDNRQEVINRVYGHVIDEWRPALIEAIEAN